MRLDEFASQSETNTLQNLHGQTFIHSATCSKHGPLTSNLCERCLESIVGFYPLFRPGSLLADFLSLGVDYLRFASMRISHGWAASISSLKESDFVSDLVPYIFKHITLALDCAWQLLWGVISSLILGWFLIPVNSSESRAARNRRNRIADRRAAFIKSERISELERDRETTGKELLEQERCEREKKLERLKDRAQMIFGDSEMDPSYRKAVWEHNKWLKYHYEADWTDLERSRVESSHEAKMCRFRLEDELY